MKHKPRKPLSPLQKKRLIKILFILAGLTVLWILLAPNMGILSLKREGNRLEELQQQKAKLEKENNVLRQELERIDNDLEYFERLAREKHGLLKKNEMIFDFSNEEEKKE